MGAAQCGICCGEREKGPDHETRQRHATAVPGNASLPDLLTNRRPKASDDDKGKEASLVDKFEEPQRGAEQDSSGSKEALLADVEEPQRGAEQEAKEKKQKAAEEREAFLRALLEEHAEAERLEMLRRKEAKRQAMLVRLEVVNQTIRKEYENCIHHPAKVSFDAEVQEIGQHAAKEPSASSTGSVKPSILKGSKFGKRQTQDGAGKRGGGVPSGEDSPGSSADSVYPEFEGDDDVFFED